MDADARIPSASLLGRRSLLAASLTPADRRDRRGPRRRRSGGGPGPRALPGRHDPARATRRPRDLGLTSCPTSKNGGPEVVVGQGRSTATVRRRLAPTRASSRSPQPSPRAGRRHPRRAVLRRAMGPPQHRPDGRWHRRPRRASPTSTSTASRRSASSAAIPIVVVAVIDDGVDFSHPDLAGPLDQPGRGEPRGQRRRRRRQRLRRRRPRLGLLQQRRTVHDAGQDGHGTHVAGTIAASLERVRRRRRGPGDHDHGRSSSSMTARLCGSDAMAIAAIDYAASFGVPIINASWGGPTRAPSSTRRSPSLGPVRGRGRERGARTSTSRQPRLLPGRRPAAQHPRVAAIDQTGDLASFSNYGATTVDLGAPGHEHPVRSEARLSTAVLGMDPRARRWPHRTSPGSRPWCGSRERHADQLLQSEAGPRPARPARSRPSGRPSTGRLVNAWRAVDAVGPAATRAEPRRGSTRGIDRRLDVSTTCRGRPATDDLTGVRATSSGKRSRNGAAWTT